MSFTDEYLALRNKKKKKTDKETSTGHSFTDEYNAKRAVSQEKDDDIAPVPARKYVYVNKTAALSRAGSKNEIAPVTKTTGKTAEDEPREASWWDATWKSAQRGYYNSLYGEETFSAMLGQENNAEVYRKILEGDEYQFEADGLAKKAVSGAAELLGQMARQFTNEETLGAALLGAGTFAGGALALGQAGPQIAAPEELVTVPGAAVIGFKTGMATGSAKANLEIEAGHAYNEMIENGVSEETAKNIALVVGGVNAGLELIQVDELFKAFKVLNKTGVSDTAVKRISKELLARGVDVAKETAQEVAQEGVTIAGVQAASKKDTGEWAYTKEEVGSRLGETAMSSALSFGAMNVPAGVSNVGQIVSDNANTKKLTANEQKVVDKEVENRIAEQEKDGKKLTGKQKAVIESAVIRDMERGYISTDTIEEVLGGEDYTRYQDTIKQEDGLAEQEKALKEEFDTLNQMKQSDMTGEQIDRRLELKEQLEELRTTIESTKNHSAKDVLKQRLGENVMSLVQNDRLAESYNERSRRGQAYQADLSKYDAKQQATIQKAIDSGILNNTNRTHEFVDLIAKITADKGVLFDFTNNAKLKESGFALDGKTVNGYVTKDGVTLNINSAKALETVVGHEITHVLEGTEMYTALQSVVTEYAKTKGEYQSRYDTLAKLYEGVEGADINAELTADLVGDYLFTDTDFAKHLSVTNRNVFQKIYDEIKYLCKVATAGSKELRELEKAKRVFAEVYRESGKAQAETKYSLETVDAVQPKSDKWSRTHTTEEAMARFPNMWNVAAEESEVRNPTQITSTVNSYRKIYNFLQSEGFNGTILDASSGLGYGTKAGIEEYGFNVDDIEPYPDKSYKPKYQDYSALDKKYDVIISNAVLNVLPQDQRDALAVKMGELLNDGGRLFVNVRGKDVETLAKTGKNIHLGNMEWIETVKGSYQKGFTKPELVAYLQDALGDGFTVKPTTMFGAVSAVVTKDGVAKYSLSDSDGRQLSTEQQEFFKDSKVRDANGNLMVMYHGSHNAGFHVFDAKMSDDDISFFFVDRNDVAASYSGTNETYTAKTLRTAEDFYDLFYEIEAEGAYEVKEENGKFVLYDMGEAVAESDTARGLYEEWTDYTGLGEGNANYKVYLNLKNPLVVDAGGRNWNNLVGWSEAANLKAEDVTVKRVGEEFRLYKNEQEIENASITVNQYNQNMDTDILKSIMVDKANNILSITTEGKTTTRDVSKWAKTQGYDGVIFKNIVDVGGYGNGSEGAATVAIAFDSNQIKSTANAKPTADKDIRYSLGDSSGRELSPAVQKRFGNSKVVDENGSLKVVYHGTATGEFSIFDKAKGSVEGDFGSGFYFTDNEADVSEHYEGGGPDFDNKVARLAEQIEAEEEIDYDEAEEKAREQLYKGSHKFEVYLNIENPAIVGETMLLDGESYMEQYNEDDFDDYDEYLEEVEQLVANDIENIVWEVERNTDVYSTDGIAEVLWDAYANGGMEIEELKRRLNDLYLEDSEGNLVANEVARQIIESLGYDGIIDPTVSGKWNMDIEEGTTHYIVFKPNQIKAITNENPTDNPDIHRSLSSVGEQAAPVNGRGTFGKDIALETAPVEEVAPVRETVAENATVENLFPDDAYAPSAAEDIAPVAKPAKSVPMEAPVAEKYEAIAPKKQTQPRMAKATPTEQASAQVLTEEPKVNRKKPTAWNLFKDNFIDKGTVFETLSLKTGNRELQAKWKSIGRAESSAQWFMEHGNAEASSLKSIRETVEKSGKTQHFSEYLYHMHNVDRMNLANRYPDMEDKPVFGYGVTSDMSKAEAAKLEKANPEFKQWAESVYSYMTTMREMMVDNGVISRETANLWAEMYPHYVPIRRQGYEGLNINVALDTKRTGVNAPIKKATGGNRNILPLFDTMALRTEQTFKAIARNRFGVELKNLLGTTIEQDAVSVDDAIDSVEGEQLQAGKDGRNPTFTVFENGERVTFEITDEMYNTMKPKSDAMMYTNKVLNTANNIRRGLLTEYNPAFMLTNPIKDTQDVLMNSQHPARTYANYPKAMAELLGKKGQYYQEYMEHGGEMNTYFDGETKTFAKEKSGFAKVIGFPLEKISQANNFIERIPRMAEYIASRKMGRSIDVSMLDAARVTTDFSAGGDLVKFANRNGFTFLNASVQGAAQQVRNVREAKHEGVKGWAKLAAKVAAAGLPAMLLNHLLWDDDEDYEELSDYVKQNYYVVAKYGDGKFVRIPKGRALAVIQNGFKQMENLITGNDEVDFDAFAELVVSNLAPNNPLENNLLAPIVQAKKNTTWYGDDLVPTRLQDLPAANQYDETTDSLSKWLGEKLNISPYKINYVLDQYSGAIGDTFLPMMTPEAERGNEKWWGNLIAPISDKFTTDSVLKNQNVSDFYDKKEELTINANATGATDEDVLMSKYMNSVNADLAKLYAAKRQIQNSDMPNAEKYEAVRDIQKQIVDLTEEALGSYGDITYEDDYREGGEYARMHGKLYKLNDEGEWSKLSDEQATKYEVTRAAGNASYATDGTNHYRWYVPGEDAGKDAEPGWRKVTDKELERQEEVTAGLGISPETYWNNREEYSYAYDNPESYAVAKAVGGYDAYRSYSSELYDIKADKDENGKSISGSRKEKVQAYINDLDADYYTKIILWKSEYTSDDTYNTEIIDYLNGRDDISFEETIAILRKLGFDVTDDGDISW